MFVYLVNVKEGVHRGWECGAPVTFIVYLYIYINFFFFFFFTYSDCMLLTDMSSDNVHPLKSFGLA